MSSLSRSAVGLAFTLGAFAAAFVPATSGCLESDFASLLKEGGAGPTSTVPREGGIDPAAPITPEDPVLMEGNDPSANELNTDGITYRDLATHPGCSTEGLADRTDPFGAIVSYEPANIPGYKCAAKAYPTDKVDESKPILLLVHGNSETPALFDTTPPDTKPMLSERAIAAGFRVIAVDMRYDRVDLADNVTINTARNYDHGWGVPIMKHFLEQVFKQYPDKQFSIVGFSLGPTNIRDALRRMHREKQKPFERIKDLVFVSGGHHGVSTGRLYCDGGPTMKTSAACQLGDRTSWTPTDFLLPLNGPAAEFETPCRDGTVAFGQQDVCGNHRVRYTTLVMKDESQGKQQDEIVSEVSSALKNATNLTTPLGEQDQTPYYGNLLSNHFGSIRSESGLNTIMEVLQTP